MKIKDIILGSVYLSVLLVFYFFVFVNIKENPSISIAWMLASVFISRVMLELGTFSSEKIKKWISAAWNVLAAAIVLVGAYLR